MHSETIGKLAEALALAQKEIKPPKKDKLVDFTDKNGRRVKYAYADLSDVIASAQDALSKNNLSVSHSLGYFESRFGLLTFLIHSSGEFLKSWHPLPDPSQQMIKPQEFGSSITYARRYSYSAIVGICSEEDDDGNLAIDAKSEVVKKAEPIKAQATKPPEKPKDEEAEKLRTIIYNMVTEYNITDPQGLIKEVTGSVKKLSALSTNQLKEIIQVVEKRAKA